ncbi:MAG TPA: dolichyl-phosphate-mannose--protein mannosyltransferase, partial [Allocoleopsis sp.]
MALQWSTKGLQILVVLLLVLGIFFRLVDLDLKPYWHDEIFTLLRVSGYQAAEAVQHLFTGQVVGIDQLLQYQSPSAEKGAWGTIYGLATEEPQHPPLYYLTARYWAAWLGSSVATTRLLPALLSLLGFPAIYWLCLELFAIPAVSVMAMVLYAVSPIYIRYA